MAETKQPLSEDQRKRIIKEIGAWYVEEIRPRKDIDDKEAKIKERVNQLQNLSDEELEHQWSTTVGEWLCHRNDLNVDITERWVDEQLEKVKANESRIYGFNSSISDSLFH